MILIIANILFVIAGILWGIEAIPQWMKILKTKSVDDISLIYYVLCLAGFVLFMTASIMINNIWLFLSHIPAFLNIGFVFILVLKYRKKNEKR